MGKKIINITNTPVKYDILSSTPKNYDKHNYFLKELQDKVNAEWEYRPNRVDIEYENKWGEQTYSPIEVVIQYLRSDKGEKFSEDCIRVVFRDILESRFNIGNRFRFSDDFKDIDANFLVDNPEDEEREDFQVGNEIFTVNDAKDLYKNVWLVSNKDRTSMTSSVVIERCNGILGSTYVDKQGITRYHYEPVLQAATLTSVSMFYNEVAVAPQSQLLIIAQYNKFTRAYKINQRFIIGARYYDEQEKKWVGQVYRVKAINRFYSKSTFDTENVGLLRIYLELTESSVYDDFEKRIAYQQDQTLHINTNIETEQAGYSLVFKTPEYVPTELYSDEITFTPVLINEVGQEFPEYTKNIQVEWELENLPSTIDKSIYIDFNKKYDENNNFIGFSVKRNRIYLNGDLIIKCIIPKEDAPIDDNMELSFRLVVRKKSE